MAALQIGREQFLQSGCHDDNPATSTPPLPFRRCIYPKMRLRPKTG